MVVTGWRVTQPNPRPSAGSTADRTCSSCRVSRARRGVRDPAGGQVPAPDGAMARRPVRTGRSTAERTTLIPAPTTTAMNSNA